MSTKWIWAAELLGSMFGCAALVIFLMWISAKSGMSLTELLLAIIAYGVLSVSFHVSRIDSRMREMFPTTKELARRHQDP